MSGGTNVEMHGEMHGDMTTVDLAARIVGATISTKRTPDFGSFSRTERATRVGRNPQTGESIQIAASKGVKISACAGFMPAVS